MSQPTISILLIEDNANDVQLMSAMLAHGAPSAGNSESPYFQLMHVAALNAGLSRLAETNFDIILTDLSLPDSHGLDTFRRLRQAAPELPLIVLTSNSDTALAIQAVREGAQDYLDKNRLDNYSLTRAIDYALERKRAEAAQRESELFSLSILNSLTAHIAVIDTDGIILVVNEAWERFARENGDPALAHTGPGVNYLAVCRRAVDSADSLAAQALAGLESVLSKSQTYFALEYPCHSPAEQRWFNLQITPLARDHRRAVVSHENITERKRAAEALAASERRFRALIEYSADAIALLDRDGKLLEFNSQAAGSILGYSMVENIGHSVFELLHPDDLASTGELLQRLFQNPDSPLTAQLRIRHKDGSWRWVEATANNLIGEPAVDAIVVNYRDITTRIQAEAALRQYTERLEQAEIHAQLGSWEFDVVTGQGWWSKQMYRMLGFEDSKGVPGFEEYLERIHPEDRPIVQDVLVKMSQGDEPLPQEFRTNPAFSPLRYFVPTVYSEKDSQGRPVKFIGTQLDITGRKQAEEAVRASEDRYRDLVENSHDLICTHDLDGRILSANPAAARLLGYELNELIGQNLRDYLAPEAQGRFKSYIGRLKRDGIASGLMVVQTRNGERRVWEYQNTVRTEGVTEPVVRGMARDITERKQAEEARQQSEALFRALFEYSPDAVVLIDPYDLNVDWPIIDCNAATCQMNGYSREELIGQSVNTLNITPGTSAEREAYLAQLRQAGHLQYETRHRHKSGAIMVIEVSTALITVDGRELVLGIDRDITTRVQAERDLERRVYQLGVLNSVAGAASEAEAEDDLFTRVTAIIGATLYPSNFGILLVNPAGNSLSPHPTYRGLRDSGYPHLIPLGQGVSGSVAFLGQPRYVPDVTQAPEYIDLKTGMRSELCVPIKIGERVIGVINTESARLDAFSPDDEQLLVTIAGHLATAIEKIRLLDALRESESKHRTLVEQLPAITYEVTLGNTVGQNRTTYISPQVESILGFTAEEWMADPGLWIKQIHPDDRERVVAEVVARDNSSESLDIEYRVLTRAGRVRWFRNQYALARANLNQPGRLHGLMLDITERKQAEEALQASETRFRALIENSADAIALTSADGTIVFASPAHTLILGYANEEIVGRSGLELIHPDDAVLGANALGQLLQTPGVSLSIQLRERHKDGSWRWLEGTAKNLLADPDVQAIVTNFRDITERKQAEARLREAEERYRLLVEQLPAIIYVIEAGLEGKTLYVSPQIESILGFTPEEWLADPDIWDRQLHPDDSDRTQAGHKISWETGNFRAEYRLLSKDGRVVWLRDESRAVLDADGRVLHMQGIAYDITERKQAEMQILLLKSAVEQSSASIVITNVAGVIEYVNPGFTELTGYSAEETIGQNPRFLKSGLTPPEEHKRLWEAITAGNQWRGEFCNRKKNGELYWELATISPITDDAGKSINFVAVKDDITDRKRAEESLRNNEARYRAVVENQIEFIVRWVPDGTRTFVNEAYCRYYNLSPQEATSSSFFPLIYKEDRPKVLAKIGRLMSGEVNVEADIRRVINPDGSISWQEWVDQAIYGADGNIVEFQSVGRDITERKQREQELALLNEISQQLIKLIAPEAIFETLFNAIGRVLDNRNLYIALYDETTGVVSFPLYTVDGERRPVASRPVGNGLTEHVLRLKEPVLIRSDMPAALREQGIALIGRESACYLGVPMLSGERAIGVLAIQDYERDAVYTERHVELFTTIAAQAAFALENARLFAAQARRVHELDTIAAVSAALRSAPTRADMLPIILDQVIDLMNCDTAALGFVSPVTGELVIEMGRGELASSTVGESFKIGEGIGGYVAATGQPYVANDLHNDPRIVKTHLLVSTRALACVPLIAQAQTIGVLWVGRAHTEVNQDTFTQDEVHLITAIADIAANAVRRAALHEETRRRVERLQALHTIDIAIGSSLDLHLTLNILLDQTLAQLEIAAACIFLFRPVTQTLHYAAGRGFRTRSMEQMKLHIADSLAGQAVLNRRAVRLDNIAETRERFKRISLLAVENLTAYYAMPLFAKGHVKGIIEFYNHSPMPIDPDWLDFAETLAGQAAIAIDNLTLFDELQRSNTELSLAYDTTLEGWSHALDLRDEETEGHSQRVTEMAVRIGQAMNLAETEIINLRRGALLHDIGKMGVPDSILHKPGKLSDEEWAVMHKHPEYAYNLLKPIAFLNSALDIPYCHHEKWDGTGYPRGLRGAEIPLAARIFAVADVSDALSNDRPYRPAWPPDKVRAYVIEQSGKHFDPQVVEVFLKLSD